MSPRADIDIAAPPEKVWEDVMDPHRFTEWVTIHRKVNLNDPGPPHERHGDGADVCLRGANFKVKWGLAEPRGRPAVGRAQGPCARTPARSIDITADGNGTQFHYLNEFRAPGGCSDRRPAGSSSAAFPSERPAVTSALKALLEH